MQASLRVQAAVQHVHPDNVRVHGVGVLPHGGLDHRLPRVAAVKSADNQQCAYRGLSAPDIRLNTLIIGLVDWECTSIYISLQCGSHSSFTGYMKMSFSSEQTCPKAIFNDINI